MGSGTLRLLEKGGPWADVVFFGAFLTLIIVVALVIAQRLALRRSVDRALAAAPDADTAVDTFRADLGPLTGGTVGLIALALWWVLAAAALIWSLTASVDAVRMHDADYLATLGPSMDRRALVDAQSAVLITRSMVGILGVPYLLISLLFIDLIWFRPRTRLLDEIRRRAGNLEGLLPRARARWSWTGFAFTWLWLLTRGLVRPAALFILVQFLLGVVVGLVLNATSLAYGPRLEFDMGSVPTAAEYFWRPVLGTSLVLLPGLVMVLVVAVRGSGWGMAHRLARGDDDQSEQGGSPR